MSGLEIKNKLQSFFEKEIWSISKNGNLYYVTLNDDLFIKPVYEIDINRTKILETWIPLPELEEYELIWSRAFEEEKC